MPIIITEDAPKAESKEGMILTELLSGPRTNPKRFALLQAGNLRRRRALNRAFASAITAIFVATSCVPLYAAELKKPTVEAFDRYIQASQARMQTEMAAGHFFWIDALPPEQRDQDYRRLRSGEVLVKPIAAGLDVPDGMIHDWVGIAFIPGATIDRVLGILQDYNDAYKIYAPEVVQSKTLFRNDDHFRVFLRLKKHAIVMVVLDIVNDVRYTRLGPSRAISESHSIHIADVENADTPKQYEDPPDRGHGYLWRLNDYGRYRQDQAGVYVQLEMIGLTRGIPFGLGWLIKPLVKNLPANSLTLSLTRTRKATEAQMGK